MNLTTLKNKIPDISNLVKKTDYNTKIAEIDDKFDEIKQSVLDSLIFYQWEIYYLLKEVVLKHI